MVGWVCSQALEIPYTAELDGLIDSWLSVPVRL